jgi:RNA polymerase sigma-70 factor (ECF subfamily)
MTPGELAEALQPLHRESFGWALSCCRWDETLAEDVLQTAYVRVISGEARYDGRSSFRTWLFGVVRRVSQEEWRRRARRRAGQVELAADPPDALEESPLERAARSERSRRLVQAMNALAERQREVLHLVFYEGLTVAEAAEVMGVSVGSARTHYHRAKKRMRVLLEGEALDG